MLPLALWPRQDFAACLQHCLEKHCRPGAGSSGDRQAEFAAQLPALSLSLGWGHKATVTLPTELSAIWGISSSSLLSSDFGYSVSLLIFLSYCPTKACRRTLSTNSAMGNLLSLKFKEQGGVLTVGIWAWAVRLLYCCCFPSQGILRFLINWEM